jgi:hypothetical protein
VIVEDLVRWLNTQLDEDERIARAATQGEWVWSREFVTPPGYHHRTVGPLEPGDAAFIATNDPARVLREIDAKRRIIAEHALNGWVCTTCDNGEVEQVFPCPTLRLLALPYADREGYREEWAP